MKELYGLGRNSWVTSFSSCPLVERNCLLRDLPRNLACPTNSASSIIRRLPQTRYVPEADCHFATRPQEVLELLLRAFSPWPYDRPTCLPSNTSRTFTPALCRRCPAISPGAANTGPGPFGAGPWSASEGPSSHARSDPPQSDQSRPD